MLRLALMASACASRLPGQLSLPIFHPERPCRSCRRRWLLDLGRLYIGPQRWRPLEQRRAVTTTAYPTLSMSPTG